MLKRSLCNLIMVGAVSLSASLSAQEPKDDFTQTAIPDNVKARFVCFQQGVKIVDLADVATFAPSKVRDVMTFSINTRDNKTHLIYLGEQTSCRLEADLPTS